MTTNVTINPIDGTNFIGSDEALHGTVVTGTLALPGELGIVTLIEGGAKLTEVVTANAQGQFTLALTPSELSHFTTGLLTVGVQAVKTSLSASLLTSWVNSHLPASGVYTILGSASESVTYAPAVALASSSASGTAGNSNSYMDYNGSALSSNGGTVAFYSQDTNLVPGVTSGYDQIYVKNLTTGAISVASSSSTGTVGNSYSYDPSLSANGNLVAL